MWSKFKAWIIAHAPFNLAPGAIFAVLTLIFLILVGLWVNRAHSATVFDEKPYVQFNVGSTVIRGVTPTFGIDLVEPTNLVKGSDIVIGMFAVGRSTWKNCPIDGAGNHQCESNLAWRAIFEDTVYGNKFGAVRAGIGISYMTNYLPYNGGNVNANLQLAYEFYKAPLTITYTHFSCGGSCSPNAGRDLLLLGWRFN
jgi:hypothetical protein